MVGGGVPFIRYDLALHGRVSSVQSNVQFTISDLSGFGFNYFVGYNCYLLWNMEAGGTAPQTESRQITSYTSSSGQITINLAYTQPVTVGDEVLFVHPQIADSITVLEDLVDIMNKDAGLTYNPLTDSLEALSEAIGVNGINQGLCYYGVVTAVPMANQFTIASLAGLGAGKFIDLGLVTQYYAFVLRDAGGGGAAPQGEYQPVTNYATGTGNFSANAFTVPVAVGDEILIIHPFLARIMNLAGLPPVTGNLAANWQAAEQDLVVIGANDVSNKVHLLVVGIQNLVGNITIRMYMQVNGVERRIYPIPAALTFSVAIDAPAITVIDGTMGIHEAIRVTVQSDNAADNGAVVDYDYILESM